MSSYLQPSDARRTALRLTIDRDAPNDNRASFGDGHVSRCARTYHGSFVCAKPSLWTFLFYYNYYYNYIVHIDLTFLVCSKGSCDPIMCIKSY